MSCIGETFAHPQPRPFFTQNIAIPYYITVLSATIRKWKPASVASAAVMQIYDAVYAKQVIAVSTASDCIGKMATKVNVN